MKKKLRKILQLWTVCVCLFGACHEPEVIRDPKGEASSKPVITIGNGNRVFITTNTIWTNNNIYLLDGEVIVRNAKLTIQPGTLIMGKKDPNPSDDVLINSSLIIDTNAQLFAQGTPTDPIVFTSNQPAGARIPGDWGGIIVLGPGIVNQGRSQIEGLKNPLSYGGNGDNRPQGSGIIQYARIEFSGTLLANRDEANGLTLAGVGANTTIDHIQVSRCNDDGFEFFGGSVNARFLISWQCRDDDFDTDLGHTGVVQYAVSRRSNDFVSTGSNGIETDNDGFGTTSLPETNTLFANITFIGPGEIGGDGTEIAQGIPGIFNAGTLIRRNSATNLINSIITAWPTGNNMRDNLTGRNYINTNTLNLLGISVGLPRNGGTALRLENMAQTIFDNVTDRYTAVGDNMVATADLTRDLATIVGLNGAAFATGSSVPDGTNPAGTPDFRLNPNLPAGNDNLNNGIIALPANVTNRGVVATSFRGAFDETFGGWNFNDGWLEFDPKNAIYH